MAEFTVTFQPEGKSVKIEKGETILNAAIKADVFINSVCGGLGKCGKCKVQVKGEAAANRTDLLTKQEIDAH